MAKKSLREKVESEYEEFAQDVQGLSIDQLKDRLSTYAVEQDRSEQAEEDDTQFQAAKELASELGAPYRDIKKALKLKRKYLVLLLKDKGGA